MFVVVMLRLLTLKLVRVFPSMQENVISALVQLHQTHVNGISWNKISPGNNEVGRTRQKARLRTDFQEHVDGKLGDQ